MNWLVFALITTVLGGILPSINKTWNASKYFISGIINFIIALLIGYLGLPHMFFFSASFVLIGVFAIINSIIAGNSIGDFDEAKWPIGATFTAVLCGGMFLLWMFGGPFWESSRYRDAIGEIEEKNWKTDLHPMDESHIRLVSKPTAEFLGNKVIGEAEGALGSRYKVGNYSIQKVKGEQYWVAPLEFRGFWKWRRFETSPGFIMVSAEDPERKAELFTGYEMEYIPSAYFKDDLERRLYSMGYAYNGLTDYTFELDNQEKPNPWYVVTMYHPASGFRLPKVDGVVVISPITGELHPNTPERGYFKPEEAPKFVDRIYPAKYVKRYLNWYGKFIHGIWNLSGKDKEVPTTYNGSKEVWLTFGQNGEQNWFTGITSHSNDDQSLTGFYMVNSRTGKAKKYRMTGANEQAVVEAVNSEFSNYSNYAGTQPILRNASGNLVWTCPVISDKGILKRQTIVNTSSLNVYYGKDFEEAYTEYENSLTGEGNEVALTNSSNLKKISSEITRWSIYPGEEKAVYHFMIESIPQKIFSVNQKVSKEVLVTKKGDKVDISYLDSEKAVFQIASFDNLNVDIQKAKIQEELEQRREEVEGKKQKREDVREVKRDLEDMSDEELLELKKELEEKNK